MRAQFRRVHAPGSSSPRRRVSTVAVTVTAVAAMLVTQFVMPTTAAAHDHRVEVCHQRGNGRWHKITVAPQAVGAHEAHGDAEPLDIVPNQPGYKFDANCAPTPFETVIVAGPERSATEVAGIEAAFAAFTATTDVQVDYVPSADFGAIVAETIATGTAPFEVDILMAPQPGIVVDLVDAGVAVPATPQAIATTHAGWDDDWIRVGTVDDTLYALPAKSDLKSLVWHRPSTFVDPAGVPYSVPTTWGELQQLTQTIIDNGQVPWCVGIESGLATGWVFTDWVEDRLLGSQPSELTDAWVANDVGFTDPRIRTAWDEVLDLWGLPGAVLETGDGAGSAGIVQTPFFTSLGNLFAVEQGFNDENCLMHRQASFGAAVLPPPALTDVAVFQFPGDAPNAPILGAGIYGVSLSDDVEVAMVHEYLATADYANARAAAQGSGYLSAVDGFDLSLLNALEQQMATVLQNATGFRFDASDLMPGAIGSNPDPGSFWHEGTRAVLGGGVDVGPYFGTTVDAATQAIQDRWCAEIPVGAAACP